MSSPIGFFTGNAAFHVFVDQSHSIYILQNTGKIYFENPLICGEVALIELNFEGNLIILTKTCELKIINLLNRKIIF